MAVRNTFQLVGLPETNKVMAGELSRLARRAGIAPVPEPKKAGTGALIYPFEPALAALATRYHRTSSRVLWDLYESSAERLEPLHDDLYKDIKSDSRRWFWPGARISIRARNVLDFPANAGQVVGAVKAAILDAHGSAVSVEPEEADLLLALRQHDGRLSLSVDLTGHARHLRGYRRDGGEAPLRENLAACLLMLTRWDPRTEALLDPMAGSGTIPIEAALMARGMQVFDPPILSRLEVFAVPGPRGQALFGDTAPTILANELHTPLIEEIRGGSARAGCAGDVSVHHGDFRTWPVDKIKKDVAARGCERGVILTNPPYGARLGLDEELSLYREFGRFCRQFPGWRIGCLVANLDFKAAFFGGHPRISKPLSNGSQPAYFYLYDEDRARRLTEV